MGEQGAEVMKDAETRPWNAPMGWRTSEKIDLISAAFVKAQSAFPTVTKDRTAKIEGAKGSYSYSYADLASIMEQIRKPLADNGLAILQPVAWYGETPYVVTRLLHTSGQYFEAHYKLDEYARPQEFGSAVSYSRRYSLAMVGVVTEEDDDAQTAQKATPKAKGSAAAASLRTQIQEAAAELQTITAEEIGDIVYRCSKFRNDDGHELGFRDPQDKRVASEKWLAKTLANIRAEIIKNSPDAEGAEAILS